MKNIQRLLIIVFTVFSIAFSVETKAQNISVSFSTFQKELSPYGRWINNPRFGQVWVYNTPGFRPYYSDGHWEYTNYGWAWVSDYDWGWAPFHYGRWEYDSFDGWMWIPGYEWGSSWVSWSYYDGYYGWAPLGYGAGYNTPFGSVPYNYWTFIPRSNICDRNVNRYYVAPEQNTRFKNAVVINNVCEGNGRDGRFLKGPERNEVEKYTRTTIKERIVKDDERSGTRPQRKTFVDRTKNNVEQPVKTETIQKAEIPSNNDRFLDRTKRRENVIPVQEQKAEIKRTNVVPSQPSQTQQRTIERVQPNRQTEIRRQAPPQSFPSNNGETQRRTFQDRIQTNPAPTQTPQRTYQVQQRPTQQTNTIRQRINRN